MTNSAVSKRVLGLGLVILAFYTGAWITAKFVAVSAPPLWATIGRLISSAAFLLGVLAFMPATRPKLNDLRRRGADLVLLSVLGTSGYLTLTFVALQYIKPSQLVAVLAIIPAITYAIAWARGQEVASAQKTAGVVVATVAVFAFNHEPLTQVGGDAWIGVTVAGLAALCYAIFGVRYKESVPDMPVVGVSGAMIAIGIVTLLPLAYALEGPPPALPARTIGALVLIGAGFSAPVYLLYGRLVQLGGALVASLVGVIGPFTVLLAETLIGLRDTITPWEYLSAAACMLGVAMIVFDGVFTKFARREEHRA